LFLFFSYLSGAKKTFSHLAIQSTRCSSLPYNYTDIGVVKNHDQILLYKILGLKINFSLKINKIETDFNLIGSLNLIV
jgi:hypothetical protein